MDQKQRRSVNHGLAFLALLGFMAGFFGARAFTTIYPQAVVVAGGFHFHHFWYGLGMVSVAAWLGIISNELSHRRVYALVFGLGGGLIGDEIGLLLTSGNYYSQLTYIFGIGIVAGGGALLLLLRYGNELKRDVIALGSGERLFQIGVVIAGLSVLAFSFQFLLFGVTTLAAGISIASAGVWLHRKRKAHGSAHRGPAQVPVLLTSLLSFESTRMPVCS